MTREYPLFRLRLPPELKDELGTCAKNAGRSLNAEIVQRLRNSLAPGIEEPAPAYRGGKSSQLLQDAIVLGEALLQETGKPMKPEEKAQFIDTLYDLLAMYGDADVVKDKIKNVISMEGWLKNAAG